MSVLEEGPLRFCQERSWMNLASAGTSSSFLYPFRLRYVNDSKLSSALVQDQLVIKLQCSSLTTTVDPWCWYSLSLVTVTHIETDHNVFILVTRSILHHTAISLDLYFNIHVCCGSHDRNVELFEWCPTVKVSWQACWPSRVVVSGFTQCCPFTLFDYVQSSLF